MQTEFDIGYIMACCNIVHSHHAPEIAADVIGAIDPSREDILAMHFSMFDLRALVQMKQARPEWNLFKKDDANAR